MCPPVFTKGEDNNFELGHEFFGGVGGLGHKDNKPSCQKKERKHQVSIPHHIGRDVLSVNVCYAGVIRYR